MISSSSTSVFVLVGVLALCACSNTPASKDTTSETTKVVETQQTADSPQGQIAFVRRVQQNNELFVINADGTGERKLYAHTHPDNSNVGHPHWTKDGTRVRFAAMTDGVWALAEIPAKGGKVMWVEGVEADITTRNSLAKDLVVKYEQNTWLLYALQKDGSETLLWKPKTSLSQASVANAQWSPDRKHVTFSYCGSKGLKGASCSVYIVSADGSSTKVLTEGKSPAWQPGVAK